MDNYPFPVQPDLTAIAIAVANQASDYIADSVLKRVPVRSSTFKYTQWTTAESYTIPRTEVGRKGKVNEVDFTASETSASTTNYGLDDPIPQDDIDEAKNNKAADPVKRAVRRLTDLVMLDREKRVADKVFASGTYDAANTVTLSGTDQWSDLANSNPIGDITTALDTPLVRPNTLVFGQAVWSMLRQHPDINKAVHGNSGDAGMARRQQVADLFEVSEVLVGMGRYNTANKGQAASYSRLWGKHCAALYLAPNPETDEMNFGFTGQWRGRVAGQMKDSDIGLHGGMRVRSGESVKELVQSTDCGYFIQDAVA